MCVVSDGVLLQVSVMYACVCVALIFAFTAKRVTAMQVRRPLIRSESFPCPTELEALFLVCTSTPLVPLDSAPGRRGNSSNCLVVAHACSLVVHYIGGSFTLMYTKLARILYKFIVFWPKSKSLNHQKKGEGMRNF